MVGRSPDEEIAALYATPPEEFVAARNELAKRLRAEGEKQEAEAVRKLKKPSVPAWALNRVATDHPDAADRLLEAGKRLEAAPDGDRLREAMAENGAAVEAMIERVSHVLADAGHDTPAYRDRARNTLRALATDEELREEFEARRVVRDREPVGFGSATGIAAAPKAKGKRKGTDAVRRRKRKDQEQRLRKLEQELERAKGAVEKARERLEAAEDERSRLADELRASRREL